MFIVRPISAADDAAAAGRVVQHAYFALAEYPRDVLYDCVLGDVAGRANQATVLVAVDACGGPAVLGCLTFVPDCANPHSEQTDAHAASFRYFGVAAAAAGQGIGRAMVTWCVTEARRLGKKRLRIHTLTMMHGAQKLYADMGFVRDPSCDADWDGVIGWAYVLHL
ncbi:MAG: GNAT family N-acetyltransferase [Myxococcales bacterium]|nr:GNAT family N-acetyltransferase [Myxococcales bacterium]